MKIEFSTELIKDLVELLGKEKAIESLVGTCRVVAEEIIKDLEENETSINE
jgi:hypothetical protein